MLFIKISPAFSRVVPLYQTQPELQVDVRSAQQNSTNIVFEIMNGSDYKYNGT